MDGDEDEGRIRNLGIQMVLRTLDGGTNIRVFNAVSSEPYDDEC